MYRLAFLKMVNILIGMNILNHIAESSRSNWSPVLVGQCCELASTKPDNPVKLVASLGWPV